MNRHKQSVKGGGLTVWFTGLSGAGKTTLATNVRAKLLSRGLKVELLDGDSFRTWLCRDLGFSKGDRNENVRRLSFVAHLLTRNDVVVLVSAISPYRSARDEARTLIGKFLEVYVNAPLEQCEARDPKGLYKRARAGLVTGFTGIDDPYEPPLNFDVECRTHVETVEQSVNTVLRAIDEAWPQPLRRSSRLAKIQRNIGPLQSPK